MMPKAGGPWNKLFFILFSQDILSAASGRFLLCLLESREANAARERQAFEPCFPSLSVRVGEYGRKESWIVFYPSLTWQSCQSEESRSVYRASCLWD